MALILVIDDEEFVRDMLRQMLEAEGHSVVEAPNGAAGLRLLREQKPALVITDILMPEKEGIETIRELRKVAPHVKIIAISGGGRMSRIDLLAVAQSFGAAGALAKPFERRELIDTVRSVLAQ
ncbi:MAG TPA: response regulator [Methylomirabilota bacterium]|nr:response regulator [Methylomirabilota bacterium]